MLGDKILDGRNRFRACKKAGIAARFKNYAGDNPLAFVLSANLKRRHLNESQRADIAAKLANMRQGARTDLQPSANWPEVSQSRAAAKSPQDALRAAIVAEQRNRK